MHRGTGGVGVGGSRQRGRGCGGVDHVAGVVRHRAVGQGSAVARCIFDGAAVQVQAVAVNADTVDIGLSCQNGVAEGQCCAATAAGIGCLHRGAVNVQVQVRRATSGDYRHRFAEGGRGSDHVACIQVIVLRTCGRGDGHAADRGCHAVNRDVGRRTRIRLFLGAGQTQKPQRT